MNEIKNARAGQIAGIAYVVMAVITLIGLVTSHPFSFWTLLQMAAYAYLAVMLLLKHKDALVAIGFGVLLLVSLQHLFVYYGFLNKVSALLQVLGYAAMTLFVLTDFIPSLKGPAKKYWYAPAGCLVVCILPLFLQDVILLFQGWGFFVALFSLIGGVIGYAVMAAGLFFAAAWIEEPEKLPFGGGAPRPQAQRPQGQSYQQAQAASGQASPNQGPRVTNTGAAYTAAGGVYAANGGMMPESAYCGLAKHVLLLLFTFGIWNLIWIYRTTENLNCLEDEPPRNPATKLLLCLFVPFYSIYWIYKSAQRIDRLSAMRGIPSDSATLCLILAIVIGIVPPILMQDKINGIVTAQGNGWTAPQQQAPAGQARYTAPQAPYAAPQANVAGAAEELKKYKELLDMGAITQEEFDEKKKQLLGL